ncbi:hypothetical protein [Shewanella algidipiscicola]|uniref:General secretion pathway protein M n=1 Tax=Shewanella algidipiscicola TaxID=614070 RepID=A0ABQ4PET2_9GAMM|nr:hypothetical protein [Shewanella algidipiscicola]GIU46053.1 hypothetical protein TUM4630_15600 [Shewanella algidipiscicola]
MQELIKYKRYLILVAVLVLMKFVWVPLWETKQDNWQQQQQAQSNLNKTRALLALKDEMLVRKTTMSVRLEQAESGFAQTASITSYKLTAQSKLESLFKRHNIELSNSSWRDGLKTNDIQTLLLDIRFTGSLKQYLSLLQELQQNGDFANVSLDSNQLSIRGQTSDKLGSVNGQVSLKLAVKLLSSEES